MASYREYGCRTAVSLTFASMYRGKVVCMRVVMGFLLVS